jgi:Sortase domain
VGILLLSQRPLGDGGWIPGGGSSASEREAGIPPVRVVLPGHVNAPVVPVAASLDGELQVPKTPSRVGWWALGAAPGAAGGTILLAGHVDAAGQGRGVFARLWDVPIGAQVTVIAGDGSRHRYEIVARRTYHRSALPSSLFAGSRTPRLALVTCIGEFDRATRRYSQNLVLYGVPVQRA